MAAHRNDPGRKEGGASWVLGRCRTVADAALVFGALTDHPVARASDPASFGPVSGLRVGRVRAAPPVCDSDVDPGVRAVFDAAMERIRGLVALVRPVELPVPERLGAIVDAEAYAYHRPWLASAGDLYDPRTKASIEEGARVDPAESARLGDELRVFRAATPPVFSEVDLVALPTLPHEPVRLRDASDPFALDACTFAFSIGGWPAVSVPCGFSASGLPVGLLLAGPHFSEPVLLALAHAYELATPWHELLPPLVRS